MEERILTKSETFSPEGSGTGRKFMSLALDKNAPVEITDVRSFMQIFPFPGVFFGTPAIPAGIPTIMDILTLTDMGDVLAMSILSDYCRYLAAAVANRITQLNVNLIILAGLPQTFHHFFEHTRSQD